VLIAEGTAELSHFEELTKGEIAGWTGEGRGEARYSKELRGWIALSAELTEEGN
jgi:hypothetical protein